MHSSGPQYDPLLLPSRTDRFHRPGPYAGPALRAAALDHRDRAAALCALGLGVAVFLGIVRAGAERTA